MRKEPIYHIGLRKDYQNSHIVYLQAVRNIDFMNCEIWQYLGQHITTKARLKSIAPQLLEMVNATQHTTFTRIIIE